MGSSTFQPRFGEDRYSVGRFILERARTLGMSRSDLVRRLHYCDIGSGHKALSALLLTGAVPDHIAKHLAEALEADDALVGSVMGATMRERCDEARLDHPLRKLTNAIRTKNRPLRFESERAYLASFRPHLQVQTERVVPSIFVAALRGCVS
jgi:hypothetical protein